MIPLFILVGIPAMIGWAVIIVGAADALHERKRTRLRLRGDRTLRLP